MTARALIDRLIAESGATDAETAIRRHARGLLASLEEQFGSIDLPVNVEVLASLKGISKSDLPPVHSEDAELVPTGGGGVEYRVNPNRPETRQRFSVAHEIGHTFFPDYQSKTWCRTDARYRRRDDPDDLVEMLCDVAASELLMPVARFTADVAEVRTADQLASLAKTYLVSTEAVLRRFAEVHPGAVVATFFSWKLKPTEHSTVGNLAQQNLFGLDPAEEARRARRLRVEYSIPSGAFRAAGHFVPADKSVENDGPLYVAASTRTGATGECELAFGQSSGRYRVIALPVWTEQTELGPSGESAVAAVLEPLTTTRPPKKQVRRDHPSLF